jgi:hypothetical protein
MKKVIILNGPPSSGKDTLTDALVEYYNEEGVPATHARFKTKLYDLVQCVYTLMDAEMEYLKIHKEDTSTLLGDISFRQALIKVSEEVIKPNYGQEYFGISAVKSLREGINIFSDGGFIEEAKCLAEHVGAENIILVRLFRPDTSFSGDSRTHIFPEGFESFEFDNVYSIDDSATYLIRLLKGFVQRR